MDRYFPVESLGNIQLYLDDNASWGVSKIDSEDIVSVANPSFPVFCLPLLETDFLAFKKKIISALELLSNDAINKFKSFPLREVMLTALSSESDYWPKLALEWVPYMDVDVKPVILALSKDKRHSQEIRHRAKALFFYLR